jgi:hypothetical protein
MDVACEGERLSNRPELLLQNILEMAGAPVPVARHRDTEVVGPAPTVQALERAFLAAAFDLEEA